MIKIELTHRMKYLHKKYFYRYVMPRLDIEFCKKIIYDKKDTSRLCSYSRNFQRLIDIFRKYSEEISIGDFEELRLINYMILKEMHKIPIRDRQSVRDVLLELFGYQDFVKKTSADCIIDSVKKHYRKEKYDNSIYVHIATKLKKYGIIYACGENVSRNDANKRINACLENNLMKMNYANSLMRKTNVWTPYTFAFLSRTDVCPYCNRQFITPLILESGRMRADIDHFLAKSQYPYFSMSLYNMIPCCKTCNSSLKHNKKFHFYDLHPYRDNIGDFFSYVIDYDGDLSNIRIKLISQDNIKIHRFLKVFPLDALAQYHSSIGKEFLQKKIYYSDQYLESILESKLSLYSSKAELKAAIIGYVPEKKDINHNVLGKLKRDLAENVGIIPNENDLKKDFYKKIKEYVER